MAVTLLKLAAVVSLLLATGSNAAELTRVSEDSFYAAATGNDVCKEYNASHVAYDYAMRGEDWATNPNKAWSCGGQHQSPIDFIPDSMYGPVNSSAAVQLGTPTVTYAGVLNLPQWEVEVLGNFSSNGLAVPVCNGTDVGCLRSPGATPKYVNVSIVNLHWHTPSEHTLNGEYFGLESHLVTKISQTDVPSCPKSGCLAVWGVWYRVSNKQSNNTFLDQILPYVNATGAGCTALPTNMTLKLADAFPRNITYVTYSGSLTTPPCSEGVLWISYQTPLLVSSRQMLAISEAMDKVVDCLHMPQGQACSPVGFESDSRILQDLNDRQLLKFSAMPRVQPS